MSNPKPYILPLTSPKRSMDDDLDDGELHFQARIRITDFLNRVAAGEAEMTAEAIAIIRRCNEVSIAHGYPTVDFQHLDRNMLSQQL